LELDLELMEHKSIYKLPKSAPLGHYSWCNQSWNFWWYELTTCCKSLGRL